ncbi:pentapeptide repeat-containing protein [Nocardioides sp. WS12]|uniref:pentapeptide repeat-containing protein n=1 Tax=Nocardioides sp. WS12 TaxID=2486272 RepID=UPI001F3A7C98|nr:pentapeptide repeat-containing protein [Nocardioides sp. WS12]
MERGQTVAMTQSARARWAALSRGVVSNESFPGSDLTSVVAGAMVFEHVDLSRADLRLATMRAFFKMCSFAGANLRGANLRGATFAGCDLTGADLRDADLRDARFSYVNTGSDNGRTNLTGVRFEGADLAGASFDRVIGYVALNDEGA